EMHKALAGITTHEGRLRVPIFANAQDTTALAASIERSLEGAVVPGYLLSGHGLYAWGEGMELARRHVEGLEFLLRCALEERRAR
ncbi:MAG: class II aldolase/adducin family protein, partial [Candidatus Eremiobacteraeota bacterium]|nr:class II aldolase/adducin family protein [Candidatus Eremiobacteraeota bacterium]